MDTKRMRDERVGKKPYTKPEIKQVQLKPGEAVLGIACKINEVGPGSYNLCINCLVTYGS